MFLGQTLLYVLMAWLVAAGIVLLIYLAISVADFHQVLWEAVGVAVHATWLIPALLLVSTGSPLAVLAGVGLISIAVRLLLSGHIPQKGNLVRRSPQIQEGQRWGILGAGLFQLGVAALLIDKPYLAAVFGAVSVMIWTAVGISSGLLQRRRPATALRSTLTIGATLILATLLLGAQIRTAAGKGQSTNVMDIAQANPPQAEKKTKVTRVFTDTAMTVPEGVPGVILRPDTTSGKRVAIAAASPRWRLEPMGVMKPVSFPFTGEYRLFPTSLSDAPPDSLRVSGTPLDARYKSFTGQPVETEAYQKLEPPFDFTNCGALRVALSSDEAAPGMVKVQLLIGDKWIDIGSDLFGPARVDNLSFRVPFDVPRRMLVSAIRLEFHRDPASVNRTAKVAIDRFELLPRTSAR
jgi:hypothetical protein